MNLRFSKLVHLVAMGAICLTTLSFALGQAAQATNAAGKLHIYFIDVEGGQATLFVPDGGESLLIDTGGRIGTAVMPSGSPQQ